jgi:molybdopterin-binding protein
MVVIPDECLSFRTPLRGVWVSAGTTLLAAAAIQLLDRCILLRKEPSMRWRLALAMCCGLLPAATLARPPADPPASFAIPYRLTDSNHILVRAKINGKGPFNLILDTGAPAVFITKAVAKKAGLDVGDTPVATFKSFELEGGLKVAEVKAAVQDLVQIDGMNGLGLAGVELHGVIGYNVLAQFRITYDFTADKLTFEPLPGFTPRVPGRIAVDKADDIQAMGPMLKMLAALSGMKPNFEIVPRGFVGIEVEDVKGQVVVRKVIADSPAAKAGLKAGDVIQSIKATDIASSEDLAKALAKAGAGTRFRLTVKRGDTTEDLTLELGKGL